MSQLGYTWYPQDWWTSETFKRLKRFPMVRYTLRELFDLMYKEGQPVEMNRDFILDDFNIDLSEDEYYKLMEYIEVQPDGKWWISSIKKRISKAEAARENGKKGGRPSKEKKDQIKPKISTNQKPNNPEKKPNNETQETPLYKEKEKEKVKEKYKVKEKGNIRAQEFLKLEKQIEYQQFEMQNKKSVKDWQSLIESFNDKVDLEIAQNKISMDPQELMPRIRGFTRAWIKNESTESNSNQNSKQVSGPEYF